MLRITRTLNNNSDQNDPIDYIHENLTKGKPPPSKTNKRNNKRNQGHSPYKKHGER